MSLDDLYRLVVDRNTQETIPFLPVYESNALLLEKLDEAQRKFESLERQQIVLSSTLTQDATMMTTENQQGKGEMAALRNETRLREKLEQLQDQLDETRKEYQSQTIQAQDATKALIKAKEEKAILEQKLKLLAQEIGKKDKTIDHLSQKVEDTKSFTKLAEIQYVGLKDSIRSLQKENDVIKDENRKLIDRLVSDKEKTSNEVNVLNEMVDQLRKEVAMLRTLNSQDDQRRSWFGSLSSSTVPPSTVTVETIVGTKAKRIVETATTTTPNDTSMTISPIRILPPSSLSIQTCLPSAHKGEVFCVRYDNSGCGSSNKSRSNTNLVTCGSDACVHVWDESQLDHSHMEEHHSELPASSRHPRHTFRGTYALLTCDMYGDLVAAGGTDKMCRVWNIQTQRMVRLISFSALSLSFIPLKTYIAKI
jgi:WD domain, G-beta repeat